MYKELDSLPEFKLREHSAVFLRSFEESLKLAQVRTTNNKRVFSEACSGPPTPSERPTTSSGVLTPHTGRKEAGDIAARPQQRSSLVLCQKRLERKLRAFPLEFLRSGGYFTED